jgi:hypothetical protein
MDTTRIPSSVRSRAFPRLARERKRARGDRPLDAGGKGQKDQILFYKDKIVSRGNVERDLWMRAAEARCWSASWLRRLPT